MAVPSTLKHVLPIILIIYMAFSLPFDDFSDLRGDYCRRRNLCCNNREDSCALPILGTLCYCDEFCNATRVHDCCPDYFPYCLNIEPPTTPPVYTTRRPIYPTDIPEQQTEPCVYNGVQYQLDELFMDNCVQMRCEREDPYNETNLKLVGRPVLGRRPDCIIDPQIIREVDEDPLKFGWTAKNYSEFWGRTLEDGVRFRLGTLPPQQFVLGMNPVRKIYDPASLRTSFDSRIAFQDNGISGIQDQGWCGSSWAISTAAVASDRYAIVSEGSDHAQLSAQNLISCDTNGQQSCNGGHLDRAWSFTKAFGLVDEECFPYVAHNSTCTIQRRGTLAATGCPTPNYPERKARYSVGPAYRLGNETDIMHEIIKSGPVQATMKVYQDFFSYQGGIYKHTARYEERLHGYHSVRIVGWGEELSYAGLRKYWIVANSWGREWGEDGYFRIVKGTNECEIESFVLASWPRVERKVLLQNELSRSYNSRERRNV